MKIIFTWPNITFLQLQRSVWFHINSFEFYRMIRCYPYKCRKFFRDTKYVVCALCDRKSKSTYIRLPAKTRWGLRKTGMFCASLRRLMVTVIMWRWLECNRLKWMTKNVILHHLNCNNTKTHDNPLRTYLVQIYLTGTKYFYYRVKSILALFQKFYCKTKNNQISSNVLA